jgi:hypothetical protein
MRSKLLGLVLICGLVAATAAPVLACDYQTNAANEQAARQTAQATSTTSNATQ